MENLSPQTPAIRTVPFVEPTRDHQEISLRGYRGPQDHEMIAQITQRYWDEIGLERVITNEEIALSLKYMDNFDPHFNLVIAELGEQPLGLAMVHWFQEMNGPRIYRHIIRVVEAGSKLGIEELLLSFAEARLRKLARRHSPGLEKIFVTGVPNSTPSQIEMLERHGYEPERYFFEMLRDLSLPIQEYVLPQGIEVRPVEPAHYSKIFAAQNEGFQDHWGYVPLSEAGIQWYKESPQFQPWLWKIAWEGHEVIGMVQNFIDEAQNQRFSRKRGYTEEICVRRPWRRKGIARALISQSLKELRKRGMAQAALGVDTENLSGALGLYQSLDYEQARMHSSYRKEITF
jgi:mycothiol synthase